MTNWLAAADIDRLSADPARQTKVGEIGKIDLSMPFVPEDYTQLYYTPIYRNLCREHRLRYNQLFGIRTNEYIMMLEADLIERLLTPLRRHPGVAGDAALRRCIDTMIEEERRHFRYFLALNRACHPALFADGRERFFSTLNLPLKALFNLIGLVSGQLAFALWYLMAMEESCTALSKDMMRSPVTETLGPLEPNFTAVHREHTKDETRHLHIDKLLIDICLGKISPGRRAANARLFKAMLAAVTRPTRRGSGVKVIRQLIAEMPELSWKENEMIRAVLSLRRDPKFQFSLFNRRAMPMSFGLFDQTEELGALSEAMVGYDRR
jgi:P-aminobenzoate N-oxygenase AurF